VVPARPRHPDYSELCAVYVDPDRFDEGNGFAKMVKACDRLLASGFRKAQGIIPVA
jgi:hypothetical protein